MPWGVCVGPRKINFDDMRLSLGRIPGDSLDKKCSELGLQGPARVKGWDTRGESVASLSERRSICALLHVCWEFLAHQKRLERQTGARKQKAFYVMSNLALILRAMRASKVF